MVKTNPFSLFWKAFKTSAKGLSLTMRHLRNSFSKRKIQNIQDDRFFDSKSGTTTLSYPYEAIPVPDHGRYQLYNEIEDCIVCDKCAKICPVDCIDKETIRSVGEFGKTSDGTSKRIYAAKFDIDMAKCCYCGLCTTVCPTECLTMTDEYDFSVFNLGKLNFGFGNMTEEQAREKSEEYQAYQLEKAASKPQIKSEETKSLQEAGQGLPKSPMRPSAIKQASADFPITPRPETPADKIQEKPEPDKKATNADTSPKKFSPRMRPTIAPKPPEQNDTNG